MYGGEFYKSFFLNLKEKEIWYTLTGEKAIED